MDFGVIQLDDEYQRFQDEVSALLDETSPTSGRSGDDSAPTRCSTPP